MISSNLYTQSMFNSADQYNFINSHNKKIKFYLLDFFTPDKKNKYEVDKKGMFEGFIPVDLG